jgi:tetratricopeptide (TPR) repeat protein
VAWLSSNAAELARVVEEQGRDDEALEFAELGERTAAAADVDAQVRWRGLRAKVFARRGALEEADRLAREAVRLAGATDLPLLYGDALVDLAVVLRHTGHEEEAAEAIEQAKRLYERKGDVVDAGRMRLLLGHNETSVIEASETFFG